MVPSIILTSKFSTPSQSDFGRYANYMSRKKALEEKGYLTKEEENYFKEVELGIEKDAEKILEQSNIANVSDDDFERYVNYMTRKSALASKDNLNELEIEELERIDKASQKFETNKISNDKVLAGVFSSEQSVVKLSDLDDVRKNLRDGQKNGSVLWQDVISFDNKFLEEKGILNSKTDTLDENLLRKASEKMMTQFEQKENLNNPFWLASIHRNREHIHIHFATVEASNSRPIQEVDGELQPRGKRVLSTIDSMKSTFINEMTNDNELLDRITKQRNLVRKNIQESFVSNRNEDGLQNLLNQVIEALPDDRKKWQYGSLQKDQKKKVDEAVDYLLKDNSNYQDLKKSIKDYSDSRKETFGKTDRSSKDYEENKLKEIKKRNANALLFCLKEENKSVSNNSFNGLSNKDNPNYCIQISVRKMTKAIDSGNRPKTQNQFKMPMKLSQAHVEKIKNMFNKQRISFGKQKALSAYEEMQRAVAMEQERG